MFLREREQRRVCCVVKRESKAHFSKLCEMFYVVLRQQQLSLPPTHAKPFFCTNTSVDGSQNKSIKLRYHHLFHSLSHTFYVSLLLAALSRSLRTMLLPCSMSWDGLCVIKMLYDHVLFFHIIIFSVIACSFVCVSFLGFLLLLCSFGLDFFFLALSCVEKSCVVVSGTQKRSRNSASEEQTHIGPRVWAQVFGEATNSIFFFAFIFNFLANSFTKSQAMLNTRFFFTLLVCPTHDEIW